MKVQVYVVDTDASVREGLVRLAASAGYEATPCDGAEAFLRQASGETRSCAVLDVSDAGLRKPAVRKQMSELASTLPVIALSARDDRQAKRNARELGARAFFRKPVDAAALLDSIGWMLRD